MQAITFNANAARWLACKAAGRFSKSVYWSRISGLSRREIPVPTLPNGQWVRLKTILGGICGTDLGLIFLKGHPASLLRCLHSFPIVLGHENVAVIDEVGPEVEGWEPGMRVVVEPSLSCVPRGIDPVCPSCEAGEFCLCHNFTKGSLPPGMMIGTVGAVGGSWAPYFVAHQSQLHPVPESLSDEQAVLVDPLASAAHGVLREIPGNDERILVIGGGIIAMGIVGAIRATGCSAHIAVAVWTDHQAEQMKTLGANHIHRWSPQMDDAARYADVAQSVGGDVIRGPFGNQMLFGGYDRTYDAIGTGKTLRDAMKFTRARGTVVEVGTTSITIVDTVPLWMTELRVLGAYGRQIEDYNGQRKHTYRIMMEWIRDGKLSTSGLLTHVFDPSEYRQAMRVIAYGDSKPIIKTAFRHR